MGSLCFSHPHCCREYCAHPGGMWKQLQCVTNCCGRCTRYSSFPNDGASVFGFFYRSFCVLSDSYVYRLDSLRLLFFNCNVFCLQFSWLSILPVTIQRFCLAHLLWGLFHVPWWPIVCTYVLQKFFIRDSVGCFIIIIVVISSYLHLCPVLIIWATKKHFTCFTSAGMQSLSVKMHVRCST